METMIRFNQPYTTGKESIYVDEVISSGSLSGNGRFTKLCQQTISERYGYGRTFMTTSCTDALEMCAILAGIQPGDEVIIPSYTFVSTALAFIRQGAKVIFADSKPEHPGMDEGSLEKLISEKTKAIVPVHYAGVACDMDVIMNIADKYNLLVIEDAAQAIDSCYKTKALGGIGHLAALSFHETKNIICGEGGALVVNDERFIRRAEVIWEKGTDRAKFFRGEIDKYGWIDIGSSFLPSELISAFLYAQLEEIDKIQGIRKQLWNYYYTEFNDKILKGLPIKLPYIPDYSSNNARMFYIQCSDIDTRTELMDFLKQHKIQSAFHYSSLHNSKYYRDKYTGPELQNSDRFSDTILRLPLHCHLTREDINHILQTIVRFYER